MPDYSKSKIYKVICSETQRVYIGSTVQPLSKRLSQHKKKDNNCMSKILIEPKIYLVESFCCDTKEELYARERYHIENTECVNCQIPGRTKKEYYEKTSIYNKEYYEKNKEKIKEKTKEYTKKMDYYKKNKDIISQKAKVKYTCECGSKLAKSSKGQHLRSEKHQAFISQSK